MDRPPPVQSPAAVPTGDENRREKRLRYQCRPAPAYCRLVMWAARWLRRSRCRCDLGFERLKIRGWNHGGGWLWRPRYWGPDQHRNILSVRYGDVGHGHRVFSNIKVVGSQGFQKSLPLLPQHLVSHQYRFDRPVAPGVVGLGTGKGIWIR